MQTSKCTFNANFRSFVHIMSVEDRIDDAVEKYQQSKINQHNGLSESDDSDAEFLDLLDDNEMARIRDDRMLQLKREFREIDRAASRQGFGTVNFVSDEKAVMEIVTKNKDVLVHFYQPDFPKCTIMNERLNILAEKQLTLQIVAIKAVDAQFLVQKLNVKVLPFVVAYKNGLEVTRIVGFERLADEGGSDFSVASLEALLYKHGVLQRTSKNHKSGRIGVPDAEESDLDLDD